MTGYNEMTAKCPHCLCDLDPIKGKPRSLDQLRRFFAVLRSMYFHWPESAKFQPHGEEHLRKWVLCQAGHRRVVKTLTLPGANNPGRLEAMQKFADELLDMGNRFGRWKGATLAVYEAKSIAFDKLGQAEFNRLNDEVEAVYKAEADLDAETL